jgi:hypothetical protein
MGETIGRPSIYSEEIATEILSRMMQGESLRQICRDEHLPHRSTIYDWIANVEFKSFADRYARAREVRADEIFDEMEEIADDGSNDWMLRKQGDDDIEVVNHEHIQRSRLRIDTRKWQLSKMLPSRYGDKIETTLKGHPGAPIEIEDRALARKLAFVLAGAIEKP